MQYQNGVGSQWRLTEENTKVPHEIHNVRYAVPLYLHLDAVYPSHATSFAHLPGTAVGEIWDRLFQVFLHLGHRIREQVVSAVHARRAISGPVVSYFLEAVLENPDKRPTVQERQEYHGRADDRILGYRFWIVVHDVDLNEESASASASASAPDMSLAALFGEDEEESPEEEEEEAAAAPANRKKGKKRAVFRTDPNELLEQLFFENQENKRKQTRARSTGHGRDSAPVSNAGYRNLHAELSELDQWQEMAMLYARGKPTAMEQNWNVPLSDDRHPYSARRVFSVDNAFQAMAFQTIPEKNDDGELEAPRVSHPMPEQSAQFHRYLGCGPRHTELEAQRLRHCWTLRFPFPAYCYRITMPEWNPETLYGRVFPHLHRLRLSPVTAVLQALQHDIDERSQLLAVTGADSGKLQSENARRRRQAVLDYTGHYYGFSELDTVEERLEKRVADSLLAAYSDRPQQDLEGRARCQIDQANLLQSSRFRGTMASDAQTEVAMQSYMTGAFGPILAESRRNTQLLDSLSATFARVTEYFQALQNMVRLSDDECRRNGLRGGLEEAQELLQRHEQRYSFMLRSRDFRVVLRKIYLMNQDMVLSRYESTCDSPASDIGQIACNLKLQQRRHQLYDLQHRPITVHKIDPRLDLYSNQEVQFYMESGALYFLSDKNRELSLMWKVRHDAYRVDFGLHYNILLISERGGKGKSMLLEKIEELSVDRSTQSISSQTNNADATDEPNMSNQINLMDELTMRIGANASSKDLEAEKAFKERLTRNKVTRRRLVPTETKGKFQTHMSYSECIAVHFCTTNADVYELMSSAMLTRMHVITVESVGGASEEFTIASKNMVEQMLRANPQEKRRVESMKRRSHVIQLLVYDVEKLIHLGALTRPSMDGAMVFLLYLERNLLCNNSLTFAGEGRNFQRTMILARINCILDALTQLFFVPTGRHYGKNITVQMLRDLDPLLTVRLSHVVSAVGEVLDLYVDDSEDRVREALRNIAESKDLDFVKDHQNRDQNHQPLSVAQTQSKEVNYIRVPITTNNGKSHSLLDQHARAIADASRDLHDGSMRQAVTYYQVRQVLKRWERAQIESWPFLAAHQKLLTDRRRPLVDRLGEELVRCSRAEVRMRSFHANWQCVLVHPCFLYPELKDVLRTKLQDEEPVKKTTDQDAALDRMMDSVEKRLRQESDRRNAELLQQLADERAHVSESGAEPPPQKRARGPAPRRRRTGRDAVVEIIQSFGRRRYQRRRTMLFDVNEEYSFLRNTIETGPTEEDVARDPDGCRHLPPLAIPNVAYRVDALRAVLDDSDELDFQQDASHQKMPEAFREFLRQHQDSRLHYDETMSTMVNEDIDDWAVRQRMQRLFIGESPVNPNYRQLHLESYLEDAAQSDSSVLFREEQEIRHEACGAVEHFVQHRQSDTESMQALHVPARNTHVEPFFVHQEDLLQVLESRQRRVRVQRSDSGSDCPLPADATTGQSRDSLWSLQSDSSSRQDSTRNSRATLIFRYLQQPSILERRSRSGCFFMGAPFEMLQEQSMRIGARVNLEHERVHELVQALDLTRDEDRRLRELRATTTVLDVETALLPDVDFRASDYILLQERAEADGSGSDLEEEDDDEQVTVYHWQVLLPPDSGTEMHPLDYKMCRFQPEILEHRYNFVFQDKLRAMQPYPQNCIANMLEAQKVRREQEQQMRDRFEQQQKAAKEIEETDLTRIAPQRRTARVTSSLSVMDALNARARERLEHDRERHRARKQEKRRVKKRYVSPSTFKVFGKQRDSTAPSAEPQVVDRDTARDFLGVN